MGQRKRLHTIVEVEEEAGHVFIIDLPPSISLILRDKLQGQTRNKQGIGLSAQGMVPCPQKRLGGDSVTRRCLLSIMMRITGDRAQVSSFQYPPSVTSMKTEESSLPAPLVWPELGKNFRRVVYLRTANPSVGSPKRPHGNSAELFRE